MLAGRGRKISAPDCVFPSPQFRTMVEDTSNRWGSPAPNDLPAPPLLHVRLPAPACRALVRHNSTRCPPYFWRACGLGRTHSPCAGWLLLRWTGARVVQASGTRSTPYGLRGKPLPCGSEGINCGCRGKGGKAKVGLQHRSASCYVPKVAWPYHAVTPMRLPVTTCAANLLSEQISTDQHGPHWPQTPGACPACGEGLTAPLWQLGVIHSMPCQRALLFLLPTTEKHTSTNVVICNEAHRVQ